MSPRSGHATGRGAGTGPRAARPSSKASCEALADEKRLGGVLQDHGIAGDEGRDDGIDGREIRVVPGRDGEHDADRLALDVALETGLLRRHEGRAPPRRSRPCSGCALRHRAARPARSGSAGPSARRVRRTISAFMATRPEHQRGALGDGTLRHFLRGTRRPERQRPRLRSRPDGRRRGCRRRGR